MLRMSSGHVADDGFCLAMKKIEQTMQRGRVAEDGQHCMTWRPSSSAELLVQVRLRARLTYRSAVTLKSCTVSAFLPRDAIKQNEYE